MSKKQEMTVERLPPSTTTKSNNDGNAKATAKKQKRLGQAKMKWDSIQQEILTSCLNNRDLQSKLTASNKRISKLQGSQHAQRPTAKQVWIPCVFVPALNCVPLCSLFYLRFTSEVLARKSLQWLSVTSSTIGTVDALTGAREQRERPDQWGHSEGHCVQG